MAVLVFYKGRNGRVPESRLCCQFGLDVLRLLGNLILTSKRWPIRTRCRQKLRQGVEDVGRIKVLTIGTHSCLCIYIYMCVYVCRSLSPSIYIYIRTYIHIYTNRKCSNHVGVLVCILYTYVHICTNIYIYTHMHACSGHPGMIYLFPFRL